MQVPEMELEVFVHGALCMAYPAAACSGYINKRDPNQGTCTNSCRWGTRCTKARKMTWARSSTVRSPLPSARTTPWAWANRPMHWCCWKSPTAGRVHERVRDEHGTYIMNSRICARSSTSSD